MSNVYNKIIRNRNIIISMVGIIATIILVFFIQEKVSEQTSTYDDYELTKDCTISVNQKQIFFGDIKDYKQLKLKKGDVLTLDFELKYSGITKPIVYFENQNAVVTAIFDGEEVLQKGHLDDNIVGYERIRIPLPDDYLNKRLTVKFNIIDDSIISNVQHMILINAFDADRKFVSDNLFSIFIGIFILTIGCVGLLFMLIVFRNVKSLIKIKWIALMGITSGLWILTSANITDYFISNSIVNYYAEYLMVFTAAICLSAYILESIKDETCKCIIRYLKYLLHVFVLISTVLTITGILKYGNVLSIFHIIVLIILLITLVAFIKNLSFSIFKNRVKIAEFSLLFSVILIYAISVAFDQKTASKSLEMIPLIALIFLSSNFGSFMVKLSKEYMSNEEEKNLLTLAYIDTLTNISNRRAFDRYIDKIETAHNLKVVIFSFDLNNLKIINDEYGHSYGDELLIGFAKGLKSIDNASFIGRIGGDEFVAFIEEPDDDSIDLLKTQLKESIEKINDDLPQKRKISYAMGYDIYNPEDEDMSIQDCLFIADDNMYSDKERIKESND